MNLSDFGYQHYLKRTNQKKSELTARIITENKTGWSMINTDGELEGIIMITMRRNFPTEELPKVGDFITYELIPNESKGKIITVLPRFSSLSRQLPSQNNQTQVLATNVDDLIIVSGLDQDFRIDQLRRYIAMAASEQINPILVINKVDLSLDAQSREIAIKKIFPDLTIVHTSAKTSDGIKSLHKLLKPNETVVFIGSSGAGKSSLINALLKDSPQSTKSVRSDGKGRHTTTRREMFVLPSGVIVVDTPGIRTLEIEVNKDELPIENDILTLINLCKFRDCDHIKSAGCAVLSALHTNEITKNQYDNFIKFLKDAEHAENKSNHHFRKRIKAKQKNQNKALRQAYKTRKPAKK